MTTTPDQPQPTNPQPDEPPEAPEAGEVDYIDEGGKQPPREITDPEFDDDGDGGEPTAT